jgi:surface protein
VTGSAVNVNGLFLRIAINDYFVNGRSSPYGAILNCWNVSGVTDMNSAFASFFLNFNDPLNCWDVSSVKDMGNMFQGAKSFNQDISSWDVSKVTRMSSMFYDTSFNQSLCAWGEKINVSLVDVRFMFLNSRCPNATNPNADGSNWCQNCVS